jgi:hypothetical protein
VTDHLTSFFPAGRDRGVTVVVEGFFAFVWFGWGQAAPPSWLVAPLAVGDGLAVLLTVAGVVLTTRSAGPLRVMADPAVRRRYSIIVGLQFGLHGHRGRGRVVPARVRPGHPAHGLATACGQNRGRTLFTPIGPMAYGCLDFNREGQA